MAVFHSLADRSSRLGRFIPLLALLLASGIEAQELELRRTELAIPEPGSCPVIEPRQAEPARPPSPAVTDSLLRAGSRAAILGDNEAAADLFRQAAALDPTNPVIAYRLASALDEQGNGRAAVAEYCRYLQLAPDASDAAEIRERVRDLALDIGPTNEEPAWKVAGAAAIGAYDSGRYAEAVAGFNRLVELRPDWPDAYYNRAVARQAAGDRAGAVQDLERYLGLLPDGEVDGGARLALISLRLQRTEASRPPDSGTPPVFPAPGNVLIRGLLVPGLGQYATGRRVLGTAVLAAAGGAIYLATRSEIATRTQTATDPFGNPYEYSAEYLDRPYQALGFGAAIAIGISAAVESYLYVQRRAAFAQRATGASGGGDGGPSLSVGAADGVTLAVRLLLGSR